MVNTSKRQGFIVRKPEAYFGSEEDVGLHLMLVHPEIPGNTGNVGRLCAGANVWLHLVRPLAFELEDRYLKRAALDYWPHVRLCVHENLDDALRPFPSEKLHFFSKFATTAYTDVTYSPGSVLLFGSETKGFPEDVRQRYAQRLVRIPTTDKVRSLNLSNACAIAAYEAMRQLEWTPLQAL